VTTRNRGGEHGGGAETISRTLICRLCIKRNRKKMFKHKDSEINVQTNAKTQIYFKNKLKKIFILHDAKKEGQARNRRHRISKIDNKIVK